jgi:hypothetical protein
MNLFMKGLDIASDLALSLNILEKTHIVSLFTSPRGLNEL